VGIAAGQPPRFLIGEMPPLAAEFTDRPESAANVAGLLVPGSALALVPRSASGEGPPDLRGVCGKTQLAVMIAESLWRSGIVDVVVWISATSRPAVLSAYVEAWTAVTGLEPADTADSVAARFVSWLAETGRPWLVVLDDLAAEAELDGLWPSGPSGRLLVTSTQAGAIAAARRSGAQVFPVGSFSIREALHCLTERLDINPEQRHGAMDLAEELNCEPLALAQALAVVATSTLTCRDYRDYFARRQKQSRMQAPGTAASMTWTFSLGRAEALLPDPSIRLMLALLALLDGHGIPGAVLSAPPVTAYLAGLGTPFPLTAGPKPAWDALLVLERVGLITVNRTGADPAILINPAVQAAIRLAAPAPILEDAARASANALLESWPADEPLPWTADRMRANAASLHSAASDTLWSGGCHPLLLRAGRSLDGARLVGPALEHWRELAVRCDSKLGPDHPDSLAVADHLADAYVAAGDATQAVPWYQRLVTQRAREFPVGHPAVVAARVSLGRALIMAGGLADAVTVLQRTAADCEHFLGPGHPDTLGVADELATAYQAAGDTAAAIRLLTRTLADRERLQGSDGPQAIATRERLASACLAGSKTKDAVSHYKQVLADREKTLGRSHPDTIATCANLAAAYQAAGRMPLAMKVAERCCADSEAVLGAGHADTLARRMNLAGIYYAVGRTGDAAVVLRDTAADCERALPPHHPLARAVRQSLANIGEDRPDRPLCPSPAPAGRQLLNPCRLAAPAAGPSACCQPGSKPYPESAEASATRGARINGNGGRLTARRVTCSAAIALPSASAANTWNFPARPGPEHRRGASSPAGHDDPPTGPPGTFRP
jgi:tetratricopeptide (TPR) repeat protein